MTIIFPSHRAANLRSLMMRSSSVKTLHEDNAGGENVNGHGADGARPVNEDCVMTTTTTMTMHSRTASHSIGRLEKHVTKTKPKNEAGLSNDSGHSRRSATSLPARMFQSTFRTVFAKPRQPNDADSYHKATQNHLRKDVTDEEDDIEKNLHAFLNKYRQKQVTAMRSGHCSSQTMDETETSLGESYTSIFASSHVLDKSLLFNNSGSLNLNCQPQEEEGQHENYPIAEQGNNTIYQQAAVCLSPPTFQDIAEDSLYDQDEPHYFLSTEPGRDVIWIQSDDSKRTHIELNICQTTSKVKQTESAAMASRKPAKAHRRRKKTSRQQSQRTIINGDTCSRSSHMANCDASLPRSRQIMVTSSNRAVTVSPKSLSPRSSSRRTQSRHVSRRRLSCSSAGSA